MSNLEIDNYCLNEVDLLKIELEKSRAETAKWKSSHDNQVELKRQLMDRLDLGERAASLQKLYAKIAKLEKVRDELQAEMAKYSMCVMVPLDEYDKLLTKAGIQKNNY